MLLHAFDTWHRHFLVLQFEIGAWLCHVLGSAGIFGMTNKNFDPVKASISEYFTFRKNHIGDRFYANALSLDEHFRDLWLKL